MVISPFLFTVQYIIIKFTVHLKDIKVTDLYANNRHSKIGFIVYNSF